VSGQLCRGVLLQQVPRVVDPAAGQDIETVHRIVDDVDARVRELLGSLGVGG
jgi:hypothetical protein